MGLSRRIRVKRDNLDSSWRSQGLSTPVDISFQCPVAVLLGLSNSIY